MSARKILGWEEHQTFCSQEFQQTFSYLSGKFLLEYVDCIGSHQSFIDDIYLDKRNIRI